MGLRFFPCRSFGPMRVAAPAPSVCNLRANYRPSLRVTVMYTRLAWALWLRQTQRCNAPPPNAGSRAPNLGRSRASGSVPGIEAGRLFVMSEPDQPVSARPENTECVVSGDHDRPGPGDHALDVIVIVIVITTVGGHWTAHEVIGLVTLILAALGVRKFKRA